MRIRPLGRIGKLTIKFQSMKPGDQLRVGITDSRFVRIAGHRSGRIITVNSTEETTTRDDGLKVPVWLVTFQ